MRKAMLMTGKPRVGKSWAIKTIIDTLGRERCGGFYTEEIREQNARAGFRLITLDGQSCLFAHANSESPLRLGRYGVNLGCLESSGLDSIAQAKRSRSLIILDEIGPMQALSARFREMVIELLDSPNSVLATIALQSHPWLDRVKQHPHVELYTMTEGNRESIVKRLTTILAQ